MSEGQADWLQMPELEEKLQPMDALPPDLNRLTECVCLIADALDKKMEITVWRNSTGPVRTFEYRNPRGTTHYQNVTVRNGEYVIAHQIQADRYETKATNAVSLAWTILDFPFTPSEARARIKKAAELGIALKPGHVPLRMPRAPMGVGDDNEKRTAE